LQASIAPGIGRVVLLQFPQYEESKDSEEESEFAQYEEESFGTWAVFRRSTLLILLSGETGLNTVQISSYGSSFV
jgi:hypothetical protein